MIRFIIETNHLTYVNCFCGTNTIEQPFDKIWNVLMLILNYIEDIFRVLAPSKFFYFVEETCKRKSILILFSDEIINLMDLFPVHIVMNIHLW